MKLPQDEGNPSAANGPQIETLPSFLRRHLVSSSLLLSSLDLSILRLLLLRSASSWLWICWKAQLMKDDLVSMWCITKSSQRALSMPMRVMPPFQSAASCGRVYRTHLQTFTMCKSSGVTRNDTGRHMAPHRRHHVDNTTMTTAPRRRHHHRRLHHHLLPSNGNGGSNSNHHHDSTTTNMTTTTAMLTTPPSPPPARPPPALPPIAWYHGAHKPSPAGSVSDFHPFLSPSCPINDYYLLISTTKLPSFNVSPFPPPLHFSVNYYYC